MRYHIRVYKVSSMKELDIEADSEDIARQEAIDLCKNYAIFEESDCAFLALNFSNKENDDEIL